MNDRFVIKRGWNQVCMFIVTIAAILLLCAKQQILLDQILGIVCVAMIWFVLFLFFIEHDRAEGLISHNRETDFKKVLYSYTAAAVVVVFASYFPEFVKPLVFVPLIIAAFVMGNWRGCHQCFVAAVWLSAFLTFEGTGSK